MTQTRGKDRSKLIQRGIIIVFWVAAGFATYWACALNLQPWIDGWGRLLAENIKILPGLGLLSKLPLVGGWFVMVGNSVAMAIGFTSWLWIQVCQIAPMLTEEWACPGWLVELKRYRTIAYVLEIVMSLIFFPPFSFGWNWSMIGTAIGDPSLIDWPNVALTIGTILSFELTVCFLIKMRRGLMESLGRR